jgi:hypothetical protein
LLQVVEYGQFFTRNAENVSTQPFKTQAPSTNDARIAEIARIAETKSDIAALQRHVKEVIEGDVFKVSHRSGQFLQYIVDQAIAGRCDVLKERVIGMELFGRSASYDTGEDAIVRVTASDVRRRLREHYGRYGETSEFQISLPAGSYIPDITRKSNGAAAVDDKTVPQEPTLSPYDAAIDPQPALLPAEPAVADSTVPQETPAPSQGFSKRILLLGALGIVILNLAIWAAVWPRMTRTAPSPPPPIFPWSALFGSSHATELITSDPNIAELQGITGGQLSASDYANHDYLLGPRKLTLQEQYFYLGLLSGNKAAAVDPPIVANIAALAQISSKKIAVYGARQIQLIDLRTDNNFIFLGSPRTDPWSDLFSDQLDFKFVFDKAVQTEFILNVHPRPNEQPRYTPTARGPVTGESFAIIALVRNPDQDGQVLLLAGATAEGTTAAGKFATDPERLLPALKQCGINPYPSGPVRHFELLLHLQAFAGSPSHIDVEACHILPDNSTH